MSDEELRMEAYYYGFGETFQIEIDRILSAVACAGKAFHHTEDWNCEATPRSDHEGATPIDWIQNRANEAADVMARLRVENEKLRETLDDAKNVIAVQEKQIEKLRAELLHWKYEVPNMTDTIIARIMWDAYAIQAGGKTFDGKPLPTWEELGEERQACWLAAANAAAAALKETDDVGR